MMQGAFIIAGVISVSMITGVILGYGEGQKAERTSGQAVQKRAAAIDACAREANVYPESCAMKAVVVSPTMPARTAALPDLLPPPVES